MLHDSASHDRDIATTANSPTNRHNRLLFQPWAPNHCRLVDLLSNVDDNEKHANDVVLQLGSDTHCRHLFWRLGA